MERIKKFLKSTKWISRILVIIWFVLSLFMIGSFESILFSPLFLLPAIIIEMCSNPAIKESNSNFFQFLTKTKIISRILFDLWILFSIAGAGNKLSNYLFSVPIMTVIFLLPAVIVEYCYNPVVNNIKSKLKTAKIERAQHRKKNEKQSTTPQKHINKVLIVYLVCLLISLTLSIVGFISYMQNPIDNPATGNQASGNLSVAVVFVFIAIVFSVLVITVPKTKEAAKIKRQNRKKPLPAQTVGGTLLTIFGGFLLLFFLMPITALIDKKLMSTIGLEGFMVGVLVGFCGLILLLLGISYLQGKHVDRVMEQRYRRQYGDIYLSKQQIYNLENKIELPIVNTPIFLNQGEVAVYYCKATRQETKNRVVGRTGSYGGGTIRIAKGFSIHTGGSSSRPIYGDVSTHYSGQMVLTNQRLIFLSDQKGFEVPYNAITAATAYKDGLSIQSRNHTYSLLLPKADLAVLAFDAVRTGSIPLAGMSDDTEENYGVYDYEEEVDVNDISYVDGMDGHEFEYFCADLLRKNGFTDVSVTPGSGDQGVDVLAEKGGVKYAIQCKNYSSPLSNTPVQEVNAGKIFYGCHVGVVMTNSTFTPGAKELAKATGVLLWDRAVVQEMMRVKNNE